MKIGDWVQATEEIAEADFPSAGNHWVHAKDGGVGHVLGPSQCAPGELWIIYWERTGSVSECYLGQVRRLGGADTGKGAIAPAVPEFEPIPVPKLPSAELSAILDVLAAETTADLRVGLHRWNRATWAELFGTTP